MENSEKNGSPARLIEERVPQSDIPLNECSEMSITNIPLDESSSQLSTTIAEWEGNSSRPKRVHPEAKATYQTAGQLMIADIVGLGVLSLPTAMAYLGWGLGILFIILFFPLNVYLGLLLWRVKLAHNDSISYMDMGRSVWRGSNWLAHFSAFVVYSHIWLTLGDYTLILGEALALMFYDTHICKPVWIIVGCLCVLPFAQIRTLSELKWLCWINMGTISFTLIIAFGYCIDLGPSNTIPPGMEPRGVAEDLSWVNFANAFSLIAFSYAGQFLYCEIMSEMKEPKEFPKSFYLSGPYQLAAYLAAGCLGYAYKGVSAKGLNIVNYIEYNSTLRVAACLLFVHMVITYLVKASVLTRAIHMQISPHTVNDRGWYGRGIWGVLTLLLLISCAIIANAIPFFESLTGIIGALLVPVACWCLPIVFFILSHRGKIPKWEYGLLAFIFTLGILLMILGTWSNGQDIVQNWEKHGAPFSCQCQHLWNTCECSAEHTGMECY